MKNSKILLLLLFFGLVGSVYLPIRNELIRYAIRHNSENYLSLALLFGASFDSVIDGARLPELIIMKSGSPDQMIKLLLKKGMSSSDRQLIEFATLFGSYDVVLLLVRNGGKFFKYDEGNLFFDQGTISSERDEELVFEIVQESARQGTDMCERKFFVEQAWQKIEHFPKIRKSIQSLCSK